MIWRTHRLEKIAVTAEVIRLILNPREGLVLSWTVGWLSVLLVCGLSALLVRGGCFTLVSDFHGDVTG